MSSHLVSQQGRSTPRLEEVELRELPVLWLQLLYRHGLSLGRESFSCPLECASLWRVCVRQDDQRRPRGRVLASFCQCCLNGSCEAGTSTTLSNLALLKAAGGVERWSVNPDLLELLLAPELGPE